MKHPTPCLFARLAAALLAVCLALSLAACGSGSNSFTWFVENLPSNLDPQVASAPADVIACENLYSGLVRKGADGQLKPALAESWTLSADRRQGRRHHHCHHGGGFRLRIPAAVPRCHSFPLRRGVFRH